MNVKLLAVILCTCVLLVNQGYARKDKKKAQNKPTDEDLYGDLVDPDDDKTGVQNDDVYGDYAEGEVDETPAEHNNLNIDQEAKILSKSMKVDASIGQVVTLPCQVTNREPVMVWKHNNAILFQNSIALTDRPNVKYTENGSLVIRLENRSDFGEYMCTILISESRHPDVVHTISESPLPAIVSLTAESNNTVLSVGDTLTLTCLATGEPAPTISWHKGERLGTTGETLTIENIRPEDAGAYRCLADNKKGKPAHSIIEIFVKHAPVVSVEKYIVNSNHESDVELKCTVHAYPAPIVNWQKDGENVAENLPKIKLARHKKNNMENILTIRNLTEEDFGVYSCVAVNALGKDARNITLVKTPAIREFHRPAKETKDLVLSWRVESKSPVSDHELQYRRKGDPAWRTIKPAEVMKSDDDTYVVKHVLKDLEGGQYETRARSQNEHGWSDFSEIMRFEKAKHGHHKHHTKKEHKKGEQKEHQTPAQQQHSDISRTPAEGASTTGSGTSVTSSIFVILSISILRQILTTKQ